MSWPLRVHDRTNWTKQINNEAIKVTDYPGKACKKDRDVERPRKRWQEEPHGKEQEEEGGSKRRRRRRKKPFWCNVYGNDQMLMMVAVL